MRGACFLLFCAALVAADADGRRRKGGQGQPDLVNPCLNASSKAIKMKYCDHKLSIEERVQDMVQRMSIKEHCPVTRIPL